MIISKAKKQIQQFMFTLTLLLLAYRRYKSTQNPADRLEAPNAAGTYQSGIYDRLESLTAYTITK